MGAGWAGVAAALPSPPNARDLAGGLWVGAGSAAEGVGAIGAPNARRSAARMPCADVPRSFELIDERSASNSAPSVTDALSSVSFACGELLTIVEYGTLFDRAGERPSAPGLAGVRSLLTMRTVSVGRAGDFASAMPSRFSRSCANDDRSSSPSSAPPTSGTGSRGGDDMLYTAAVGAPTIRAGGSWGTIGTDTGMLTFGTDTGTLTGTDDSHLRACNLSSAAIDLRGRVASGES